MTVNVLNMGPGSLVLGDVGSPKSFSSQVTNCRITPSVDKGDPINVLSGEQVQGDRDESFVLAGTFVQDFGTLNGLSEWTWDNRGDDLAFVFIPNTAAGRQISGTVTVEATEIGGDVKTKPSTDFEWTLVGAPTLGAVAP